MRLFQVIHNRIHTYLQRSRKPSDPPNTTESSPQPNIPSPVGQLQQLSISDQFTIQLNNTPATEPRPFPKPEPGGDLDYDPRAPSTPAQTPPTMDQPTLSSQTMEHQHILQDLLTDKKPNTSSTAQAFLESFDANSFSFDDIVWKVLRSPDWSIKFSMNYVTRAIATFRNILPDRDL